MSVAGKGRSGRLGVIMSGLIYFQHVIIFYNTDEANGQRVYDYDCKPLIISSSKK